MSFCSCSLSQLLGHISTSTVVLVCDLVNGSIAQQDGRLKKADQLLFIGEVNVIGQPVSVVVDILKATRSGPVVLKVRHAKHCSLLEEEEEVRLSLHWLLIPPVHQLCSDTAAVWGEVQYCLTPNVLLALSSSPL